MIQGEGKGEGNNSRGGETILFPGPPYTDSLLKHIHPELKSFSWDSSTELDIHIEFTEKLNELSSIPFWRSNLRCSGRGV